VIRKRKKNGSAGTLRVGSRVDLLQSLFHFVSCSHQDGKGTILQNAVGLIRSGKVQNNFCEPVVLKLPSLQTPYEHIARLRIPDITTFKLSAYLLKEITNYLLKLL
jgi:hypothetical protein